MPEPLSVIPINNCFCQSSVSAESKSWVVGMNRLDPARPLPFFGKEIRLGAWLVWIGPATFAGSDALARVDLGACADLMEIGGGAFAGCRALERVTLATRLYWIGEEAFQGCAKLKEMALPAALKRIGARAFADCAGLEKLTLGDPQVAPPPATLPRALEQVGRSRTDKVPPRVRRAAGKDGLARLLRAETLSLGAQAFAGCSRLTELRFPGNVKKIPEACCKDCVSLQTVTIPEGVTAIEAGAFAGCTSLARVTLPKSLETLDEHAFEASTQLLRA